MSTIRLIPSTYYVSNTSYLKGTNINNMYANTDNTNYATWTNSQTGTTSYYLYIRGFNFDAIPSNAIVSGFKIKFKAKESGVSTSTSYRPYICNNTSTITCSCSTVGTTAKILEFTGITADWDTIKGYGANFGIRLNCIRNKRNTTAYMYVYGAEIEVEYTVPIPYDITTSGNGCTVTPNGTTTVYNGDKFSLRIESDSKPTVTDNGIDVSDKVVEREMSVDYTVEAVSGASYGFAVNSNGYYESQNKAKASTCALCIVSMNLPVECTVNFKVINYAESTYDYGILSDVDETLNNNASADTNNVYWSGKNNNSSSEQIVTYTIPAGEHFIYAKYFKNSYTDSNNDTLQFKVEIIPNETFTFNTFYEYIIDNVNENHNIIAVVFSDNKTILIKVDKTWKEVSAVYKKINGSWVKQVDLESLFNTSMNYIKAT